MKIEQWDIKKIIPYDRNPRKNDHAVEKVVMSIKEYGWQQPIVVDKDGIIIVGHTRLKAAKKLKLKTCPVVVADNLTESQVKAYRIADNRTGELSNWDHDLLDSELRELIGIDFDIELTGFDLDDLKIDLSQEDIEDDILDDDIDEKYTDKNCEMPIVPDFFENHQCFLIVTHSKIDEQFVRQIFELNENHISTSLDKKERKTNVVSVDRLRELWLSR